MEHLFLILNIPSGIYLPHIFTIRVQIDLIAVIILEGVIVRWKACSHPIPSPSLLSPFLPCALCRLFFFSPFPPFSLLFFQLLIKTSHMLGKCSTTKLHPQPWKYWVLIFSLGNGTRGLTQARQVLDYQAIPRHRFGFYFEARPWWVAQAACRFAILLPQLSEQLGSQACTTRLGGTACFFSCLLSCISFSVFCRDGLMSQHGKEHIAHILPCTNIHGVFNAHM